MICNKISLVKCICGKLEKEIPCQLDVINCGQKCGKKMSCGEHTCLNICHKGDCYCYNKECVLKNKNVIINNSENFKRTTNINLKGKQGTYGKSCEFDKEVVYCGRSMFMGGWKLNGSIWANPFKVKDYNSNEQACNEYEKYLINNKELLSQLPILVGKKLACWCVPQPCHTDIIIKIMKEKGLQ